MGISGFLQTKNEMANKNNTKVRNNLKKEVVSKFDYAIDENNDKGKDVYKEGKEDNGKKEMVKEEIKDINKSGNKENNEKTKEKKEVEKEEKENINEEGKGNKTTKDITKEPKERSNNNSSRLRGHSNIK